MTSSTAPRPLEEYPPLLTVHEASELMRIGVNLTYEMVRTGELPSRRFGRVIRIPRTALLRTLGVSDGLE
ncbi:MAG: helix-turn-helix domain-containing protein [Actinomycetota bacterium]|nr:helix-turn-helix domain-containing protein [Actinomycetota bacterium]